MTRLVWASGAAAASPGHEATASAVTSTRQNSFADLILEVSSLVELPIQPFAPLRVIGQYGILPCLGRGEGLAMGNIPEKQKSDEGGSRWLAANACHACRPARRTRSDPGRPGCAFAIPSL